MYAARRAARPEYLCAHCGNPSGVAASELKRGRKYCSQDCYDAVHRKHDRPAKLPCEQCGTLYPTSGRAAGTRFCSSRCFGASLKRPGAPPPCEQCGKAREWEYGTSVNSVGPYCSRECAGLARRKRSSLVCQVCGTVFQQRPSEGGHRRTVHCSQACRRVTAERNATYATCKRDGCEVPLRVVPSQLAHGEGKYCSLACRGIAWRRRVAFACQREGCSTVIMLRPSEARQRRYCSQRCSGLEFRRLHPLRMVRCRGCKKRVLAPEWRARAYCSLGCTNRRHNRRYDPVVAARNARILELHATGLVAPTIQAMLCAEDPAWTVTPAAVRQVIHRAG